MIAGPGEQVVVNGTGRMEMRHYESIITDAELIGIFLVGADPAIGG